MLARAALTKYLEKVAAGTAVPGGGSVAALNAALAAGLTEMVAHLTIGKKGYEAVEAEMKSIAQAACGLRQRLTDAIDRDADAYSEVMAAYRLPKASAAAKSVRNAKIQQAFKQAARVPLEVAREAIRIIDLVDRAIKSGNQNAVTDGLVAALNARTAALAALYNVKINLESINDKRFVNQLDREIKELEKKIKEKEKQILATVKI